MSCVSDCSEHWQAINVQLTVQYIRFQQTDFSVFVCLFFLGGFVCFFKRLRGLAPTVQLMHGLPTRNYLLL